MENKVATVLIASGSGTDADAIMKAYRAGFIPEIDLRLLVSTKKGAACLEKARTHNIKGILVDQHAILSNQEFNEFLQYHLKNIACRLVFLVGCIKKILPIEGVAIYNIHPADLINFGGKGMYGLKVHEKVLLQVEDLIARGRKTSDDRFFTYPTIHEVTEEFDSGQILLQATVEIPKEIIHRWLITKEIDLKTAAEELQRHVLPYEWAILPTAVAIAAKKILSS